MSTAMYAGSKGGQPHQQAPPPPPVAQGPESLHPPMTRIQDLVRLLQESEDPLWELVKFEAETSAAQDEKAAGLIQQRVLDQNGIHSAARDFLATKLQTTNVPVSATTTACARGDP